MKKNIRKEDRHKLLQTIDNTGISEEGFLGGVSLNKEKIKRWRTEIDNRTTSVNHAQCDKGEQFNKFIIRNTNCNAESTMSSRNLVKNFARTSGPRFRTLFPKSQLTRQLVSPPNLHITEDLLHSINLYISGMYAQKLWKPVRNGDHHISSAIEHESQQTLDKFYSGCMAAFSLLQAKSYVEARRVLSSACSLVRSVVLSSHPETLSRFLDIFYDLQHGKFGPLHEVLNLLRNYIGRMAMEVLPRAHPWRNICYLLGKIDIKELDQTMLRSAKYMADVSGREGGKISDIYLDSQLLYIQWAHVNQLSEEEEALRKLLAEVRAASVGHPRTFMIMQFISASLRKQGRLADYETAGKEFITAAQAYGANQNLFLGFLITALAQYLQGKKAEAEANQRQGVTIILGLSEPQRFTWAMQHLSRLEQWLREWGHSEDAEQTKAEIDGLVRQDTASEEELLDLNE